MHCRKVCISLLILAVSLMAGCVKTSIPDPRGLGAAPVKCSSPVDILGYFEGIPYRGDAAINSFGDFTFFAEPGIYLKEPGLNCSGFTVAASRYYFARNFSLADTTIDRLADSGPDSPFGEDWDFGYDLVLNLTEGLKRRAVLPFGQTAVIEENNGMSLRGFELSDRAAWADVIKQMKPGHVYLFSMSKDIKFKNYKLLHYHVGLIVPDDQGHIWLCHATRNSGVNKVDISNQDNLDPIIKANPDTKLGPRKILLIEAPLVCSLGLKK
ncbi:hypothetical protein Desal_2781 [Maridesulfovibrio salexigens DSM 2638]|uniref:DUF1460 domain-containing protein n=1 Tax=Maridesulfovibrio salexigens (strain ATCC 14822 / DSM 2638 / NCIMB 8403 / VKM B-1763) TaxID=526222 RepID=C6BZJ7_MARSD|nr:hypothetical protein Desal_2781 [Maridesulfovibrio salexigens DSM 2638]